MQNESACGTRVGFYVKRLVVERYGSDGKCMGSSTQTSSSGYGPIWTSGWQSMESRPEGRRRAPPPEFIREGMLEEQAAAG